MRIHKLTLEALERLLFHEFVSHGFADREYQSYETEFPSIQQLTEYPDHDTLTIADANFVHFFLKYLEFKDDVRQAHLGKAAQFWIDYIGKV